MKMEPCNGGDPENNYLLAFYDWEELTDQQKKEAWKAIGRFIGRQYLIHYIFGKGFYYGQHIWFVHKKEEDNAPL